YHSGFEPIGIAGEAVVVREGYPDTTAFDPNDIHYDPRSDPKNPSWYRVDVKFVRAGKEIITLKRLREIPALRKMMVLRRGRLSVQPVTREEWKVIMKLPEWG
ncbi:MAG TPA: EVE domain-containing protein, partial [Nitrospiria bacterium]|nr:EVE domain-containing protein [Nitrospiria bacterium]